MNVTRYSPKVSVILPIYNTEPYLIQCVSSIQNQTLSNIEIICIDDNSNDNSAKIIKESSANDKRIIAVYNTQNMGVAYCRNLGIKMSKGEYLVFLDSDDYFDKEMLKKGVNALEKNGADIVFWEAFNYDNISKKICFERVLSEYFRQKLLSPFSPNEISEYIYDVFLIAPWHRMYRREFIISNELWYQSLSNSNDVYFSCISPLIAKKIVYVPERLVYRRRNRQGQIYETRGKKPMCPYKALLALRNRMIKESLFDLYRKSFFKIATETILSGIYAKGSDAKIRSDFCEFMSKTGWENLGMSVLKREDFISDFYFMRWEAIACKNDCNLASKIYIEMFYNEKLIRYLKNIGQRFCIWGFGIKGRKFLDVAKKYGLNIVCIVDINSDLWGKCTDGLKILPIESQHIEFDSVLLITIKYYDEVKIALCNNGKVDVKIIDVDSLILYGDAFCQ